MLLFMYVESSYLDDIAKPVTSSITEWIKKTGSVATFIDQTNEVDKASRQRDLGIHLRIRKKGEMKDALKKLYEVAKKNKCEFAVGIIDEKRGTSEEVCFFGYEEGKPDAFEIANYLGLM